LIGIIVYLAAFISLKMGENGKGERHDDPEETLEKLRLAPL